jgi:hypothetical protein
MNEIKEMQLTVSSGSNADEGSYMLWEQVWAQTFSELDGATELFSDNFTRQHEILSLTLESKCIALVCHRFVNLSHVASAKDSYFKPWPKEIMFKLGAAGPNIAIGSQITIHPEFRQSQNSLKIKNIITYLSLRSLREKDLDAITGVMRADKGMNNLFYQCGAEPLLRGTLLHNVPVDLLAFFPKRSPLKIPQDSIDLIEGLWTKRNSTNLITLPQAA